MILLTLVTLGLYVPYWFLSRRRALNRMTGEDDNLDYLTFAVAATHAFRFGFGFYAGLSSEASALPGVVRVVDFASGILTIVLGFRVKSILEANHPEPLSALGTFFLSIFYLQYKINRMGETDPVEVRFTLR
jgi:hypothetical protein